MGGDKSKEENKHSSTYLQDLHEHEFNYSSKAGAETNDNISFNLNQVDPEENLIPVTCDNMSFDLNQVDPEENLIPVTCDDTSFDLNQVAPEPDLLPDFNTTDISSSIFDMYGQGFYNSDSFTSHQINKLVDTNEGSSMFYKKRFGDFSFQKNHKDSKIGGNFLSHGFGDDTENGIYCNGRTGEPNRAIFPHSSSPGHQLFGRFPNSQNEGLYTDFNNHAQSAYGSDAYLGSSQFHTLQYPLPVKLSDYTTSNIENPFVMSYDRDTLGRNWDHQKVYGGELDTSSIPFNRSSPSGLSDFGNNLSPTLGLESKRPSLITDQVNKDLLFTPHMETFNSFSSESSTFSTATRARGNSIEQENTGNLPVFLSVAAHNVKQSAQLPKRELVQPEGQLISLEKDDGMSQAYDTLGVSSRKRSPDQPPPALRIQSKKMKVSSPMMPPVTNQPPAAPRGSPTKKINFPKVDFTIPVAPKADASFGTPTIPPQYAKMRAPSRVIRPLLSSPPDSPIPDSPPRVKWQDPNEFPPPLGERCLLCKRDLLFTAEGPVFQPDLPPPAAVLPCGHTFHEHCLHIITPQDQSTHPPCIPCAIGEL